MVFMFMLYHMEKENRIKLSIVYEEKFNDDKKNVREIYIREKILEEYLFLKSIENDKEKISKNKLSSILVSETFNEKYKYSII